MSSGVKGIIFTITVEQPCPCKNSSLLILIQTHVVDCASLLILTGTSTFISPKLSLGLVKWCGHKHYTVTARAYGNLYSCIPTASQFHHSHIFLFRIFIGIYALANTHKDFTHRLVHETSIFRLDFSAATRIYVKKGLAETSFVIAVI